jgi:hypothetical protein
VGATRSARTTRATRFGRSLSLPPLSVVLLATIAPPLRDALAYAATPHAPRFPYGVVEDAAAGVAEPAGVESGMGGTNAVSIILEYSIETLPARSILVALAGSAYVYTASLESLSQDTRIAISLS